MHKDLRESQRKQQEALEKLRSIKEDKRHELIRRKEQAEENRRREEERKKQEEERRRREEEEAQRYFAVTDLLFKFSCPVKAFPVLTRFKISIQGVLK